MFSSNLNCFSRYFVTLTLTVIKFARLQAP